MSATAKLDVKMTADGSQVKTEVQGVARAVQDAAGQMARAYASVSVQVKAVSSAISGWQKALGLWNQFFVAVNATVEVVKKLADWWQNAGRASEEYAQTAKAAMEEAKDAGGDAALFTALKDAADAAGVSADEFAQKLREFKEHKITFDELAASIGSTRDALLGAADAADPANVGLRYVAGKRGEETEAKEAADRQKANRAGVAEIVSDIFKKGGEGGNGPGADDLWDLILEAAGGDIEKAKEIFDANRSWRHRVFGGSAAEGYGELGLLGAKERWDARGGKSQAQADREAEVERNDEAARAAAAEKAAKAEAEAKEKAAREAKTEEERAAREAESAAARKAAEDARAARELANLEIDLERAKWQASRENASEYDKERAAAMEKYYGDLASADSEESRAKIREEYALEEKRRQLRRDMAADAESEAGEEPAEDLPVARASAPLSDRLRRVGGYVGGPSASFDRAQSERVRHTRLLERIARATETKLDATATLG